MREMEKKLKLAEIKNRKAAPVDETIIKSLYEKYKNEFPDGTPTTINTYYLRVVKA